MTVDATDKSNHLNVISFEPHLVQIEITNFDKWKETNSVNTIKIGAFLKIEDGSNKVILALVKSYKMKTESNTVEDGKQKATKAGVYPGTFIINAQPIGQLEKHEDIITFIQGIKNITIPPSGVSLATPEELQSIFSVKDAPKLTFAEHLLDSSIKIQMDGDKFFSKHIAVVGSTGSGKSCTVAKIIQEAKTHVTLDNRTMNNSHIIIFDIHGEYKRAFPEANYLSVEDASLKLPYWLMNSEELEDMFIESNESNSHNQVSQFKHAVINNKRKYNPDLKVTYDSPVYFSIEEVYNYICNKNDLTIYQNNSKTYFASISRNEEYDENLLWEKIKFEPSSGNSIHQTLGAKIVKDTFSGEFNRFISRLKTKMNDERLDFLLSESSGTQTSDLKAIISQVLGYVNGNKNITIVDLSSLPFEVVSIVVSIVSRLVFDFAYYSKTTMGIDRTNETPFMLVYEEAHKYIPKTEESRYKNTRAAVERIAKEGRKYGVSAMIVSQRPSEISSTVLSQCNNFIVMRLTNPDDQSYIRRILPEAVISYGDALSSLEKQEALIVGDAISTPTIGKILKADPTPHSDDIQFYTEWQKSWQSIAFEEILGKINKPRSS